MKPTPRHITFALLLALCAALIAGCSGSNTASAPIEAPPTAAAAAPTTALESGGAGASSEKDSAAAPAAAPQPGDPAQNGAQPLPTPAPQGEGNLNDPSRKIIKNADFTLEVANVSQGMGRIGDAAAQYGGYVIETRNDASGPYRTGVVKVAVPVERFESLLQRIRESAGKILNEQASGVDVTQEFVDVQSQIANLEATQARIRSFLDKAANTEEALRVNAELTTIEGQISQLKGRIQFLSQRAAYSTVTVTLQEPPVGGPTPEPTPGWSASKTAERAGETLTALLQGMATVAIWVVVVVLPFLLPLLLVILLARSYLRRRPSNPTKTK